MLENVNKSLIDWDHLDITDHSLSMLAYWDQNLICRYANQAYLDWFGKGEHEMVNKIKMQDLLGDFFHKYLPFIIGVLEGKVQRFEREIETPSGEIRRAIATFTPDYENEKVKGFFIYVSDVTSKKAEGYLNGFPDPENNISEGEKILDEVVKTLKSCLLTGFPGITPLAKLHFISESKLKRDFKARYNSSIFSYYRTLQMELAEKYLHEKKFNKKQLAIVLNFSNPSNFSACYKKYRDSKKANSLLENINKAIDERYKTFVSQAPYAIAMLDKDMKYMAFSNQWLIDYGCQERELIGTVHKYILPELETKLKEIYKISLTGEVNKCDEEFVEKIDGSKLWIKWDIRPWYNYNNVIGGLLICTEDISALKLKDLENAKMLEILNKTNEIARIGTWKRDFKNNTATWSKITKEILEVPESTEPAPGITYEFYKEGRSRNLVRKAFKNALENGLEFDIEVNLITYKGNLKRVRIIGYPELSDGTHERIAGIFQDISKFT
ncbi:PAS domain S-box protein [Mucilaginibacter sabulilitoris]|uniref:PAS domain S-box protein n=1 Tax=Mucilaginibacter sabulilitoris TaxID=1173583 RepID=A0ABZ0TR96_9SPHI|nr:PAS domain S-box protein [Mucilaginibacter sabulilitoris]WPU95286.1 PAS domain S-box protein [Mucilaginibacter sabulilitoris]